MTYTLYILHTSGDTYYTGITNDLDNRLHQHRTKSPQSAKYLRRFDSFTLVYTETLPDRSTALRREHQIKRLTRMQKIQLITSSS